MVANRCSILGCNQFEKVNPFLLGPIVVYLPYHITSAQDNSRVRFIFVFRTKIWGEKISSVIHGKECGECLKKHTHTVRSKIEWISYSWGGWWWASQMAKLRVELIETVFIHTKLKHLWNRDVLCHFPLVTNVRVAGLLKLMKDAYFDVYMSHSPRVLVPNMFWNDLKRKH